MAGIGVVGGGEAASRHEQVLHLPGQERAIGDAVVVARGVLHQLLVMALGRCGAPASGNVRPYITSSPVSRYSPKMRRVASTLACVAIWARYDSHSREHCREEGPELERLLAGLLLGQGHVPGIKRLAAANVEEHLGHVAFVRAAGRMAVTARQRIHLASRYAWAINSRVACSSSLLSSTLPMVIL